MEGEEDNKWFDEAGRKMEGTIDEGISVITVSDQSFRFVVPNK